MQLKNTQTKYGAIAKLFHWAMAFIILGMLALGLYMSDLDFSPFKLQLYGIHKSFGSLVFLLAVLRVLWRFSNKKPQALPTHKKWEITLAHITHILLYVFIFVMPLSGWLMTSAAAFPHPFFGLFNVPPLMGKDEAVFKLMRNVHEFSSYGLMGIIGLHVAGALKHLMIDKDTTIKRMWPDRPIVLFVGLLVIFGALIALNSYKNGAVQDDTAPTIQQDVVVAPLPLAQVVEEDNQQAEIVPSWVIIPDQSYINFDATVEGTAFEGTFERFGGIIAFDPENLAASHVEISVEIASVKSGSSERDEYIVAPAWFDAESFPESVFTATKFEKNEGNQYVAHGELRIKDVSLPVDLPFMLVIEPDDQGNNVANMTGSVTIRRLEYSLGTGQWADTETVGNEVTISVSVKAQEE